MKNIILKLSVVAALLFSVSCRNSEGNMQTMTQMKDSIWAAYPTIAGVLIHVENDNNLVITLGSQDLYAQDEVKRQAVANEIGAMALRIFGKDNKLEHGKILVTQNEANQDPAPANALVSQMDFVTLKRAQ
ncbi:MAG: hypothetical protein WC716_00765 [Chitinophagaceae bacterium]|jgi:hypothetical protein